MGLIIAGSRNRRAQRNKDPKSPTGHEISPHAPPGASRSSAEGRLAHLDRGVRRASKNQRVTNVGIR